jgi:hypothetical protein
MDGRPSSNFGHDHAGGLLIEGSRMIGIANKKGQVGYAMWEVLPGLKVRRAFRGTFSLTEMIEFLNKKIKAKEKELQQLSPLSPQDHTQSKQQD